MIANASPVEFKDRRAISLGVRSPIRWYRGRQRSMALSSGDWAVLDGVDRPDEEPLRICATRPGRRNGARRTWKERQRCRRLAAPIGAVTRVSPRAILPPWLTLAFRGSLFQCQWNGCDSIALVPLP